MSERISSAPTPESVLNSAQNNEGNGVIDTIDQAANDLGSRLQTQETGQAEKVETNTLELSPEEEGMRRRLDTIPELGIIIRERATRRINKLEGVMNSVYNRRDEVVKRTMLLEYRESRLRDKSTRLEAELKKATPGSRQHRKLQRKYGKTNRLIGERRADIGRLAGAPEYRASEHERKKALRDKKIQLRRDMLTIGKKVAYENKRRRDKTREMKRTTDEDRKKLLKQELANLPNIGKFRQNLLNEAMTRYKAKEEAEGNKDHELDI